MESVLRMKNLINNRVHEYYWNQNLNCAVTTIKILSELYPIEINAQVMDASTGMNGAGRFGSQCGLVEGVLMFIGIYGIHKGIQKEKIIDLCNNFSKGFQQNFGSLLCRELRPQGFSSSNPPHLCEDITKRAVSYSVEFIAKSINLL